MATKATATTTTKKDKTPPMKKEPTTKKTAQATPLTETKAKKIVQPAEVKPAPMPETQPQEQKPKKPVPKPKKPIQLSAMQTTLPKKPATTTAKPKTVYHVSKRDNDGREWKVFIQESSKVIKLFATQAEALEYAKQLCKNKDDGSYVILHGLNGKIRKY